MYFMEKIVHVIAVQHVGDHRLRLEFEGRKGWRAGFLGRGVEGSFPAAARPRLLQPGRTWRGAWDDRLAERRWLRSRDAAPDGGGAAELNRS